MTLPVARTAQTTYAFVAANALTLLRLTWLPLLINSLAATFSSLKLIPYLPALESKSPSAIAEALGPALGWILLGLTVPIVMSAVAGVAILRCVVRGDRSVSNRIVHVAFGAPELRMIAVTLLIAVMLFLVSIPLSLLLGLLGTLTSSPLVTTAGSLAVVLVLMIIGARWIMAYPVAAIEDRINFDRAWSLIRTGYASFLILMLSLLLPLLLLDFVTGLLVSPHRAQTLEVMRQEIESKWILLTATGFVINFIVTTVFFTALGIVYRTVTNATDNTGNRARGIA